MRHPNLIFYLVGPGGDNPSGALLDCLRFGMDYANSMAGFGNQSLDIARKVSRLSPISSCAESRKSLRHHRWWMKRDSAGEPSTSDIDGCFDAEGGPHQYFPGRFHKKGTFEASPYVHSSLWTLVTKGDTAGVARMLSDPSHVIDVNAWDVQGETVLFLAARRGDLALCANLILAAADPNCRDRTGQLPLDHVPKDAAVPTPSEKATAAKEAEQARVAARRRPAAKAPGGSKQQPPAQASAQPESAVAPAQWQLARRAEEETPARPLDARELRKHCRTLLKYAGGLSVVLEEDLLAAVAAVPEPDRRRLCSRFGITTAPELLPERVPIAQVAKASQVLFTKDFLAQAEALGKDQVAALQTLRTSLTLPLEKRRNLLRVMLRDWHPDKQQGKSDEERENANAVFCYIQGLRSLFLGEEAEEGKKEKQTAEP